MRLDPLDICILLVVSAFLMLALGLQDALSTPTPAAGNAAEYLAYGEHYGD